MQDWARRIMQAKGTLPKPIVKPLWVKLAEAKMLPAKEVWVK